MNHSYFFVNYSLFKLDDIVSFSRQIFYGNVVGDVSFHGFGYDGMSPGIVIDGVVMIMCKKAINIFLDEK